MARAVGGALWLSPTPESFGCWSHRFCYTRIGYSAFRLTYRQAFRRSDLAALFPEGHSPSMCASIKDAHHLELQDVR